MSEEEEKIINYIANFKPNDDDVGVYSDNIDQMAQELKIDKDYLLTVINQLIQKDLIVKTTFEMDSEEDETEIEEGFHLLTPEQHKIKLEHLKFLKNIVDAGSDNDLLKNSIDKVVGIENHAKFTKYRRKAGISPYSEAFHRYRAKYKSCPNCKKTLYWTYPAAGHCLNCGWVIQKSLVLNYSTGFHDLFDKQEDLFKGNAIHSKWGFVLLTRLIPKIATFYNETKHQFIEYEKDFATSSKLPATDLFVDINHAGCFSSLKISDILYSYATGEGVILDFGVGRITLSKEESQRLRGMLKKAEKNVDRLL